MKVENITAYEVIEHRFLEDLKADGYLLRHKKSGARLFLVSNDDNNKVFSIGFRTPPIDSTGLTHILEHSVLCGSKEFPAKDPFVELVKGSLNTFLNAMTYSDKTVYPVASCNDKDFQNLMHVYLDAVFYPNIYKREEIFRQEGWHYELESPEDELKINGVVYNEMKGAFSSPEGVLEREILNSLYPDNCYQFESGGDPEVIPELSYEKFLNFHSTYYHPSNSYIYLYGDMDMAEKLEFIDSHYLSQFDYKKIDTEIQAQEPFTETHKVFKEYSITEEDSLEDNTYLSYNVSVGSTLDRQLYLALQILDYALLGAPGAPLKQALLDAGVGKDIMSSYDNGILQPMFSVIAKNANKEDLDRFLEIIDRELKKVVENGFDRKSLLAGINVFEFRYREADFGRFPIGLSYGLNCMDSWLYDEKDPFMHLEEGAVYAFLKEQVDTDYYEKLVEKYLLNNSHSSIVVIEPKRGLTGENDKKLSDKLAAYKATLTEEEIQKLVDETAHLKSYQSEPSTKEELESIPMLELKDIGKKSLDFKNRFVEKDGTTFVMHDYNSKGICYFDLYFSTADVAQEDLPYLGILSSVMGYVDTASYSFSDLANEINIHTGGYGQGISVYTKHKENEATGAQMAIHMKALYKELPKAFELIEEILTSSKLEDKKRLKEILAQTKSRMQMQISGSGNAIASIRGMSYFSESAAYIDATGGVEFYRTIEDITDHFEERVEGLQKKLSDLIKLVFTQEKLMISCTALDQDEEKFIDLSLAMKKKLPQGGKVSDQISLKLSRRNEGFKTASKVNYVARCGSYAKSGLEYTGALMILRMIMGYDYMWNNIRVLGGAYGCMCSFDRNGDSYFVSYRDPNLSRTEDVYEGIPKYLETFDADDRAMLKFIIGTISAVDTPLNASALGLRSMSSYLSGRTLEEVQKTRDQILGATVEDIRALAPYVKAILDDDCHCTVGDETKIQEEKQYFLTLDTLQ